MQDTVFVRTAKPEDYSALKVLCAKRFGDGYLQPEDYGERLRDPELFLVAEAGGRPVAAVSLTPETPEKIEESMQLPAETVLSASKGKPILHIRTAVVEEAFEKQGLVRRLLIKLIETARQKGYGLLLSATWKYNGYVPAARLQEALRFTKIGERSDLWYHQGGYACLVCKGPCRCKAVLYQLQL